MEARFRRRSLGVVVAVNREHGVIQIEPETASKDGWPAVVTVPMPAGDLERWAEGDWVGLSLLVTKEPAKDPFHPPLLTGAA